MCSSSSSERQSERGNIKKKTFGNCWYFCHGCKMWVHNLLSFYFNTLRRGKAFCGLQLCLIDLNHSHPPPQKAHSTGKGNYQEKSICQMIPSPRSTLIQSVWNPIMQRRGSWSRPERTTNLAGTGFQPKCGEYFECFLIFLGGAVGAVRGVGWRLTKADQCFFLGEIFSCESCE